MKKFLSLLALVALSLGFSSCCSMFGAPDTAEHRPHPLDEKQGNYFKDGLPNKSGSKTKQVLDGYDVVYTSSKSGKGGLERRVPRYKTVVIEEEETPCPKCVRYYCPKKDCCGTTSEKYLSMVTAQGPTGSPFIGLVPTMKPLAE